MEQYTKTSLHLQNFEQTSVYEWRHKGYREVKISGFLKEEVHKKRCPYCGYQKIHANGTRRVRLKHLSFGKEQFVVEVKYTRWECQTCHACFKPTIPFKEPGHNMTRAFKKQLLGKLSLNNTVSKCSEELHVNRNLVKEFDKNRLQEKAGNMKPTHPSPFICVDEFLLHKNHEYATVVIDYCTGESLYVTQGKTYGQMIEFFHFVGYKFMQQVVAVSMDMNASYAKAFREWYPHIKIVYDGFHIIKNYNDMVLTEIRRAEQRRLIEEMEIAKENGNKDLYKELYDEYKTFKNSRYILLGNRKTLELKDEAAKEHNRILFEKFGKRGLKTPIGKRYWSACNIERLEAILAANEKLQVAHNLGEMLKSALYCRNPKVFETDFKRWLFMAEKTGYEELLKFCNLIRSHWKGFRNRVEYPLSNGPLEGTNCLIKNIRRQSYGIRDDLYFFLKIWEATRKHPKNRVVT